MDQINKGVFVIKPTFGTGSRLSQTTPLFMSYNSNLGTSPLSLIYKNKGFDI